MMLAALQTAISSCLKELSEGAVIKDLLGSTESSSVGDSSTSGFSAESLKTENFIWSC